MKPQYSILVFCTTLMIFSGCKKTELEGQYAKYEGRWEAPGVILTLYYDGKADYTDLTSTATNSSIVKGRLLIKNNTLKISSTMIFTSVEFKINSPPTKIENSPWQYKMILDNKEFHRY